MSQIKSGAGTGGSGTLDFRRLCLIIRTDLFRSLTTNSKPTVQNCLGGQLVSWAHLPTTLDQHMTIDYWLNLSDIDITKLMSSDDRKQENSLMHIAMLSLHIVIGCNRYVIIYIVSGPYKGQVSGRAGNLCDFSNKFCLTVIETELNTNFKYWEIFDRKVLASKRLVVTFRNLFLVEILLINF